MLSVRCDSPLLRNMTRNHHFKTAESGLVPSVRSINRNQRGNLLYGRQGYRGEDGQRMIWINGSVVCFLTLSVLWTLVRGDTEVSCVFMESCILLCSFQVDTEVAIHWIQVKAGNPFVHSYFLNQDQLAQQDQHFRGRTSLFKDQISGGNASLRLTGVELQDQSRYKCITSTTRENKESFINLKVDAPVIKVDIQQVENRITCSSDGIYPEPELTWSTNPPSTVTLQNKTTVHQTEQQLYNINSYLIVSVPDLVYSCTVSTRRNRRRASLRQLSSVSGSSSETTIPCTSSNTPLTELIWRFNHRQIILSQTRANVPYTVSEEWRQQVKSVSESGSLTLQHLSSNQEGIYTCELSDDDETYVTNTLLMIEKGGQTNAAAVIVGVVVLIAGLVIYCMYKKKQRRPDMAQAETEMTRQEQQQQPSVSTPPAPPEQAQVPPEEGGN